MKIAIIGAGNIGLYVGGRLIEAGGDVVFLGRERMRAHIEQNGLRINSYLNHPYKILNPKYITDYAQLGPVDYAIITAKTTQTHEVLRDLIPHLAENSKIINLQNGVDNKDVFRDHAVEDRLVEGMVMYNVVINEAGEFFQSSSGPMIIDLKAGKKLIDLFLKVNFEFHASENVEGHKWSKLLLNLNNSLNAIAGVPIKEELEQRGYRLVLAKLMEEALKIIDARKIRLENLTTVPMRLIPFILRLPNPVFRIVAKKMVNIDPLAKSSMLMDIERNAPTEIDQLNARIVEHGHKLGVTTPVNAAMVELIRAAEARHSGPPRISAADLLRTLHLS